jgi:hypothetical protein
MRDNECSRNRFIAVEFVSRRGQFICRMRKYYDSAQSSHVEGESDCQYSYNPTWIISSGEGRASGFHQRPRCNRPHGEYSGALTMSLTRRTVCKKILGGLLDKDVFMRRMYRPLDSQRTLRTGGQLHSMRSVAEISG